MKLLATDLDGTIVTSGEQISPAVREVLAECLAAGVLVVAATGRPMRWLTVLQGILPSGAQAICSNGAVILDLDSLKPLEVKSFESGDLAVMVEKLAAKWPSAAIGIEGLDGLSSWRGHDEWRHGYQQIVDDVSAMHDAVKVLVRVQGAQADELRSQAQSLVGHVGHCSHSNAKDCLVEIAPSGVHKAATLAEFAAARGIDAEDVVAFGDMPNDLEMLQWAGRGYAMGNAHPDVLAATSYHAPSVEDDGVAVVVRELLGQRS